ncbi:type II toxin-antitoxin system VapC family toxin [Desulfotomaculum copahuensis]|uniref:PIN domain-containing protein n=1 Tax=Desulfotomaculum copahuensis TaxID=1838280 RepID=A0A1B7LD31_9FIRM|nr:type II toxin-antitoxin system VapC family toxin [Desulfotomaculum copahuensis]OAT80827.1 hypothetical protein A6M21_12615 [Desulfotomaculum copahuensis]
MAKYLLDTDWAIYYLRGKEPFVKAIDGYRKDGIAISTISIAELYEGVYRSPKPAEKEMILIDFLEGFRIISITRPIARLFGMRRAELRNAGLTVSDLDLLIACVADYHELSILTNNQKHFKKVPGVKKLISLPV